MSWKYRNDQISDFVIGTTGAIGTGNGGIDLASANGGTRPPGGLWHTGNNPAMQAADGVNSTPVITEIYLAAVFIPFTILATGIAVFNGSDVTDNVKAALIDKNGNVIRASASTAGSGTDAYQLLAFATGPTGAAATTVVLPSDTYYIGTMYAGTTSRFNTHGVGAFPGGKATGATFATAFISTSLTGITIPTAFTAASLPPIASVY